MTHSRRHRTPPNFPETLFQRPVAGIDFPSERCIPRQIWESNPQFGQNVIVLAQPAPQQVPVLNLDEHGPPRLWTLALGISYNSDPRLWVGTGSAVNDIVGEVTFGTGSGISAIEVDWLQGVKISVPANTLRVIARVPGLSTSRLPESQTLSAVIAPGTTPRGLLPVRSRSISPLAGASPVTPIPPYAARVWLTSLAPDIDIPGAFLDLYGDPEGTRLTQRIPLSAASAPGARILGGSRFARLDTPVGLADARLVYEIDT